MIVSCVTQGMKNKEIAVRVGTTEQVVKNYLRKVYDKLGVADRLELALYCLNNRVVEGVGRANPLASANNGHLRTARAAGNPQRRQLLRNRLPNFSSFNDPLQLSVSLSSHLEC